MLLIDTYLAPSPVDGIGVFTLNHVEKGTLIWQLEPRFDQLIERELYEKISGPSRTYLEMYCYPFVRDRRYLVLEADDARFMNHAEHPNCDFEPGNRAYALSRIPAGTELTCDYRVFFGDALEMLPTRNGVLVGLNGARCEPSA